MAIYHILESMLNEIGGSIDEEPLNFETSDTGEYTFDAVYTQEDGEEVTIPMEVSIETNCYDENIYITFKEQGGGYNTTDKGETTAENNRLLVAK